jgi:hypothetical protein
VTGAEVAGRVDWGAHGSIRGCLAGGRGWLLGDAGAPPHRSQELTPVPPCPFTPRSPSSSVPPFSTQLRWRRGAGRHPAAAGLAPGGQPPTQRRHPQGHRRRQAQCGSS